MPTRSEAFSADAVWEAAQKKDHAAWQAWQADPRFPAWQGEYGRAALHFAAMEGFEQGVRYLLEKGAPPDPVDCHGATPLMNAIERGRPRIARLLLEAGAAADHRADDHVAAGGEDLPAGWTPLLLAVDRMPDLCGELLEKGARLDVRLATGWTPFLLAAAGGNLDLAQRFARHGADVMATMPDGKNALDLVVEAAAEVEANPQWAGKKKDAPWTAIRSFLEDLGLKPFQERREVRAISFAGRKVVNSAGMEFLLVVPPGPHLPGRKHGVFLARTPVTAGHWRQVMGERPPGFRGGDQDVLPMDGGYHWGDLMARFMKALNGLEGHLGVVYRFPRVAEWVLPVCFPEDEVRAAAIDGHPTVAHLRQWCRDQDQGAAFSLPTTFECGTPWRDLATMAADPRVAPAGGMRSAPGFEGFGLVFWELATEAVDMFRNVTDGYETCDGLFACGGDATTPPAVTGKGIPIIRVGQPGEPPFALRLALEA